MDGNLELLKKVMKNMKRKKIKKAQLSLLLEIKIKENLLFYLK